MECPQQRKCENFSGTQYPLLSLLLQSVFGMESGLERLGVIHKAIRYRHSQVVSAVVSYVLQIISVRGA